MPRPMKCTTLVGIVALALATGCEPCKHYNRLQVAAFAGGPVQKRPYGTIEVFQTADDVKRAFKPIGLMTCEGSAEEEAAILNAMLYRAADMGADGVVLNTGGVGGASAETSRIDVRFGWAAFIGNGHQRAYRAEAIRFTDHTDQTGPMQTRAK